eukprot:scpid93677/ scgid1275/ 
MMKSLSEKAGTSRIYTNHCLRATCVTVLQENGFSSNDIMSVTGHKNAQSLLSYSKPGEKQQQRMAACLDVTASTAAPLQETTTWQLNQDAVDQLVESYTPADQLVISQSAPSDTVDTVDQLLLGMSDNDIFGDLALPPVALPPAPAVSAQPSVSSGRVNSESVSGSHSPRCNHSFHCESQIIITLTCSTTSSSSTLLIIVSFSVEV